jgi:8-oxo-dGTP diphosphatase
MAQTPILGAGGVVVRTGDKPLIAIVQRRKDDGWVLPKGKLKRDESAVAAAEREVREETGQDVVVGEFLGAVSYRVGRRPKVVQFWRMQACDHPVRKLARDIKAVKWLPLEAAIRKLTDPLEQVFLQNVAERKLAAPMAEQGTSAPKQSAQPEQPTALTLSIGEQPHAAKPPVRKVSAAPQAAPADCTPTPAATRSAEGQIAVLAPDQPGLKLPTVATWAPGSILSGPRPLAATKRASAVTAGDVAAPAVARLNLLDRILHRLWRNRTTLSRLLRWTSGNARRSGR